MNLEKNETILRNKYGRNMRDIRRESGSKLPESMDISKEINELLDLRSQFKIKNKKVHRAIKKLASDCFMYYPHGTSDNDVQHVRVLDYEDNIRIEVQHIIEQDKVEDFCERTNLKLIDIEVEGSYFNPQCTYIFAFDRIKPHNPCEGCISNIECNECEENGYW